MIGTVIAGALVVMVMLGIVIAVTGRWPRFLAYRQKYEGQVALTRLLGISLAATNGAFLAMWLVANVIISAALAVVGGAAALTLMQRP